MKYHLRIAALSCAALWAFACVTSAQLVTFQFDLDADQAALGQGTTIESDGTGSGFVTLDTGTGELTWEVSFQDLTTPLGSAHFHGPADPENTEGVVVNMAPLGDADGETSGFLEGSAFIDSDIQTMILDHMTYINLHTEEFPVGEIRGQVIPEPRTYALIFGLVTLTGVVLWRYRRSRQA